MTLAAPLQAADPAESNDRGLVVVIDDVGHNDRLLVMLLSSGLSLHYAVLPSAPLAESSAARVVGAGRPLLVHMPMESPLPEPDECRLLRSQTATQRRQLLQTCAAPFPAQGLNNHEGSLLTTDSTAMGDVGTFLREQSWFFLDSMTTPDTVGKAVMRKLGVPVLTNDFFLDNDNDEESIRQQLLRALERARTRRAVVIGHLRSRTVRVLIQELTLPRHRALLRDAATWLQ